MTAFCARCHEAHEQDAELCALCAARVELDNAEVAFTRARAVCGSAFYETWRLSIARKAYDGQLYARVNNVIEQELNNDR